jgi:hypothetical protein
MPLTNPVDDVLLRLAEKFAPTPSAYLGRPVEWVRERANEHLTSDQQRICYSVVENRYTAVPSCHDAGKSFSVSRLAAWWIDSHPLGEALVVSTAPTASQVGSIVWREIGTVHRKVGLPGYITGDNKWKIEHPGSKADEIGIGRKPADYDPAGFQGLHRRYVLVIIDEAGGVPKMLFDAVDSIATNKNARVVAIGNPDDPSSHFATICQPGSGWNVLRINGLRQPTMTKEALEEYPALRQLMISKGIPPASEYLPPDLFEMLIDPLWVDERIKRWGIDSPLFQSKVLGEFPTVANDSLIHPHWIELAKARELEPKQMLSRLGVDVARYGKDRTILVLRQGGHCRVIVERAYGPVTETAGLVVQEQTKLRDAGYRMPTANVDDTGVGGGVVDILQEQRMPVQPIVAGEAAHGAQLMPNGKPRFFNRRAELMWNMREAFAGPSGTGEDGWLDIDPFDLDLHAQLTNIKYKVNRFGQIQVESKDEMSKRGLPSPDRADALSYSLAPDETKLRGKARPDKMITGDLLDVKW